VAGTLCLLAGFVAVWVCGCGASRTLLPAGQHPARRAQVLVAWTSGRGDRDLGEVVIRPMSLDVDVECIGSGRATLHLESTSLAESVPCAHAGGEAGAFGGFGVTDRRTVRVLVTAAKTTKWFVRLDQDGPAGSPRIPMGPVNAWIHHTT